MKLSGGLVLCFAALFLSLTPVHGIKRLHTINDLKNVDFGRSVPKHSLLLLHWFANTIDIDNNDVMRLTFDPNLGTYGSHHYGNYERILDPLPHGNIRYRYYTVGNLNRGQVDLPVYVLHPPREEFRGRNRDRIIFRVREQTTGWSAGETIDEVYITQHFENSNEGTRYDPAHTYRITTNLLRQIREFSVEENQRNSLMELRDDFGSNISDSHLQNLLAVWRELACLGLLLFMILEEKYNQNNKPRPADRRTPPHCAINVPEEIQNHYSPLQSLRGVFAQDQIHLEVTTGPNGKALIHWRDVPEDRLNQQVMVVLYKDNSSQEALYSKVIKTSDGHVNTSVLLNPGLQARLHKTRVKYCFWTVAAEEICRGREFENPDKVRLQDYDMYLQLFVKDGKAGARLFVDKTFTYWRSQFNKSWVGFYENEHKTTQEYEWWQWQWATKFQPASTTVDHFHDVYEYHSGMTITPGVQARFILRNYSVLARTPSWR
ncbi:uncharacterized protein LOC130904822 [Corythoichthys intestinalis]|uniref:uncharacterized protein LOC130904822 n=1 Tax=Corythoichthys intestinalis TaxID=161448 RepID=UPI0025A538C3|nr:uncharacterized protein LOC130904822 [Corythoichthys intestinalis]XP_061805077.1 uncharacterized protein LOC133596315 [Nerophis lumbriciformis]